MLESFPLRERGLKLLEWAATPTYSLVVPLAGTWIETERIPGDPARYIVVPLAGTWIETIYGICR